MANGDQEPQGLTAEEMFDDQQEGVSTDSLFESQDSGVGTSDLFQTPEATPQPRTRENGEPSGAFDFGAGGDPWKRGFQQLIEFGGANIGEALADFRDGVKKRIQSGVRSTLGEGTAGDIAEAVLLPEAALGLDTVRTATEGMKTYARSINARPSDLPPLDWNNFYHPNQIYSQFAEGAPLLFGMMAATVANPTAGALYMSAVEGADSYKGIKEYEERTGKELPLANKLLIPITVGTINGQLERLGINKILKSAKVPGAKNKIVQILASSGTEGVTETGQEITSFLGELTYDGKVPDNIGERFVKSFYGGAVLGLGASGATSLLSTAAHPSPGDAEVLEIDEATGEPTFRINKSGHELEGQTISLEEMEQLQDVKTPAFRRNWLKNRLKATGFAQNELEAETEARLVDVMASNRGVTTEQWIQENILDIVGNKKVEKGDLLQTLEDGVNEVGVEISEFEGTSPESGLVPTILTPEGKMFIGNKGDIHASVFDRFRIDHDLNDLQMGFTNRTGKFLSREEAARFTESKHPLLSSEFVNLMEEGVIEADELLDSESEVVTNESQRVGQEGTDEMTQGLQTLFQVNAWHGTPHDFDKFSFEKIGTGEGAQAFGWGLYFTESREIAEYYAKELSGRQGEAIDQEVWSDVIGPIMQKYDISGDIGPRDSDSGFVGRLLAENKDRMEQEDVETLRKYATEPGAVLKVSLNKGKNPSDYQWMPWRDQLSDSHVRDLRITIKDKMGDEALVQFNDFLDSLNQEFRMLTGEKVYRELSYIADHPRVASQLLADAGFAGVRYRAEGGQSDLNNYVVMDESIIDIEGKETLYQMKKQTAKAAVQFDGGKAIVKAFNQADVSSWVHEMAHVYRRSASGKELQELNELFEVEDGKWTRNKEEEFARKFESYVMTGTAESSKAQVILNRFRSWMMGIYAKMINSPLGLEITQEQRDFFDRMFNSIDNEIQSLPEHKKYGELHNWYDRFMNWLDVERAFQKIGFGETGFHIKNYFSVQGLYSEEGAQLVEHVSQLLGRDSSKMLDAILIAEDSNRLAEVDPETELGQAAQEIRDYFDRSFEEYNARGGLDLKFKERLIGELRAQLDRAKNAKEEEVVEDLLAQIQEIEDTEFVHIPYVHWFSQKARSNPREAQKFMSLIVERYKRKIPTIQTLIDDGVLTKDDVKLEDIIASYSRQKGKDFALLNIRQAAIEEGAAVQLIEGEKFPNDFVEPPRNASVFKGYRINKVVDSWINTQLNSDNLNFIQRWFNIAKMAAFWNPLFLPMYDVLQANMAGSMNILRPIKSARQIYNAFDDVLNGTEDFMQAEANGISSKPYNSPLEEVGARFSRAARVRHKPSAGNLKQIASYTYSYGESAMMDVIEKSFQSGPLEFIKQIGPIRPLVRNLYQGSWDIAWMLDRTIRQVSYNAFREQGFSSREAAQKAAETHADYASLPPKSRKFLNTFFFTPTFKVAMGKWMGDSIKAIGNTVKGDAGQGKRQLASVFIRTLGILVAYDMLMLGLDFERDEFGRRYTRRASTATGEKDLVINWTGPHNLFLKYIQRTKEAFGPEVPNVMKRVFQQNSWEIQPLIRVTSSIVSNETPGGDKIWWIGDSPETKLAKGMMYFGNSISAMLAQLSNEDEFGKAGREAFAREYGQALELITSPFLFKYTREVPEVRLQNKLRSIMAIHEEEVQAGRLLNEILKEGSDPNQVVQDYLNGEGIFTTTLEERNENLVRRMMEIIEEFEEDQYQYPTDEVEDVSQQEGVPIDSLF